MNRRIAGVLVAGLCLIAVGCARQRTATNEWGCSFGAGPVEQSRNIKNRLAPGDSAGYSNDDLVTHPADVRFFYIDNDPATADFGTRPIVVPAKGSSAEGVGVVPVSVEVQTRFVINENACDLYIDNLKRLDDAGEMGYNAAQGEESLWGVFLTQTMNQKLIEATRPVLANVDYITLFTNGPIDPSKPRELAYDVLADELSENLSRELEADLGGKFFCGPSYQYDGEMDGSATDCPPLEVTVKSITPQDPKLIENLTAIVANEEQQRRIESDTVLAKEQANAAADQAENAAAAQQRTQVAQAQADQEIKVAQAEADRAVALANEEKRRAAEEARAATDLAVAQARAEVAAQEAQNTAATEAARATYCLQLATAGIRCDLLASAEAGQPIIPKIDLSGSADGGSTATVVLDARP